jgi:predicted nuclease of restriction endonuclease-like (RecB) superfamily
MTRAKRPKAHVKAAETPTPSPPTRDRIAQFDEVVALIEAARGRAYHAVNTELVSLYWQLGEYINRKIANAEWGDGVVEQLAGELARRYPGQRGFTSRNLFRMRQFFEAYRANEKLSPLVTQLPWTHHLIILSQARPVEAREHYILAAIDQRCRSASWERQIQTGAVRYAASGHAASGASFGAREGARESDRRRLHLVFPRGRMQGAD